MVPYVILYAIFKFLGSAPNASQWGLFRPGDAVSETVAIGNDLPLACGHGGCYSYIDMMTGQVRRIGILTGGGDCPGINAVIRAVYRSATLRHGWQVLGIGNGFEGLIDLEHPPSHNNRWLSDERVREILTQGGSILGASNRANPFCYVPPGGATQNETDVSDRVLHNFGILGLDALVCVGGDGTMDIAHRLAQQGMPVVGVPKTIDNDLLGTDYTFGFNTAVQTAVDAIDRLHTTAESHDRVMFIEVMGRNTGWIALYAGIAGGADVILIPELPYSEPAICAAIRRRLEHGQRFCIVVVAEGARPEDGESSYATQPLPGRARRLGGAAEHLAAALASRIELEHRVTVLGHLQRGGSPNAFDRLLATRFGTGAVELVAHGLFDQVVCVRSHANIGVPIVDAIAHLHGVDRKEELLDAGRSIGISFGSGDELEA